MAPGILQEVEARVNEVLLDDLVVSAHLMSQAEARAMGARGLELQAGVLQPRW